MNKVFKVVWSKAVGQWVVTSEFGTAAGGRTRRTANRLTTGPLAALSLMTALALYGPSAMAAVDITNIGFETGTLSGWTYSKTGTQGSTSYGTTGVGAAVVTGMTDFEADNGSHTWTVTPFGNNMASLQAGNGSDTFATAAAALGLNAASSALVESTMAGAPRNASWLYQDLTLAAGDYFSMAWQYVSTDYEPFNDASLTSLINLGDASVFATVNNQNAQYALLGATNLGTGSYSTGSYGATGWQVATYQVSTAGTYRLGFLSLNLKDTAYSPVLFVDQAPGLTFDKGVPFGPVAPNPGSGAPTTPTTPTTPTGPIIIDGPKGTDELGNEDEASFEGGTLVVDKDTNVDVDFKIDDKPGTIDQNGHDSTFTGKIDDATNGVPGSLIVKNSGNGGSVTLTNTNGYTGTTEVDENATLALSGNGSIDKSKKLVIDGTLDVTQAGPVVNIISLDGKGDVALGNNTLSITDANDEFEGTIGGQGDVAIKGGTQVLSGNNTYAGGTSVSNNAVLQVSTDENLGDAAGELTLDGGTLHTTGDVNSDRDVVLAGDGTFDTDTNTTLTNSGDVSGTGGLIKNGEGGLDLTGTVSHSGGTTVNEGELTLSGQNTYTGGTTLNGGVLNVSSDGNLGDATGGLTFNGGTLHTTGDVNSDRDVVLAGDGTFTTDTNTTLTNSGDVSGTGGLIKNGEGGLELTGTVSHSGGTTVNEGELTLSGQNTYTGGTTLNGGVLNVSSDGNLGDAAGGLTFNGGTLHTTGDVNSDRDVILAGNGTFDTDTNTTLTNSGDVSGTGGLIKNGEGGLELTGTVSHSGGTTVNDGELTLSGQNTYTGGTMLNGGVLNVSSDGNLGDASGGLTFNGGTLHTTGDVNSDRDVVLAGDGTFNTDTNTTLTNSGDVSGTGGLIKNGEGGLELTGTVSHSGGTTVNEGELTLSGQNTYTGGTTLNGGVLNVSSDGNLGDAAGGLTFNGGTLHTTGDVNSDRDVILAGNGTFDTDTNTTLTNSGDVSGNGGLIKNGEGGLELTGTVSHSGGTTVNEGELTLSGQNTYTGGTTLNGGVLNVSSDGNLGDATGGLTFNGGTLHTTGDVNSDRDVVLAGDGTFTTDTNTTLTNSGDVSGTGGLIKNGEGGLELTGTVSHSGGTTVNEGELTLSGQNTYTGGTTLNGGVLNVSSDGNLGDAAGGLTFNGGTLHTTGDVNSDRDVILAGNGTFDTDTNTTLTNSGDVSGNGGLIKNGEGGLELTGTVSHSGGTTVNEGELTLSGQNTYTGGTTLNGGVLNVSSDGNLGDATGGLTFNGGTLHTTGDVNSDRDVVLAGDGTFTTDTNTTLTNSGDVSGTGGLIKNGEGGLDLTGTVSHSGGTTVNEGELTLSGQNTYTGGTTLNGGVLNVSSDGNLGDAAGGLTFNGGTLHTTGDVNSDRDVVLAGDGTFNTDANTTLTNSGDVSGNGGLVKNGEGDLELTGTVSHSGGTTVNEGELTLSGQNTYTGGTTLNGGVLNISSDGNLGDATGGLTFNGGTLQASSSMTTGRSMVLDSVGALRSGEGSTLTVNGPISGGGTLVADGQGTLVLGAANTHAGGTLISGGTVVLAHAGGLGSGTVAINDATLRTTVDTQVTQPLLVMGEATLDVASGTTTQLTGMLDGSRSTGCFIKSGAGRLNLAGTAVLANGTCVNEGTLSANGVLMSNVQVERDGTVRGTGNIAGNMRVDGTLAPGNSPGTLAVTGTVTLTDDATLQIDIDGYGTGAGAGNYSRLLVSGAAGRFVANGTLQPLLRGISGNAGNTFTPKVGDMFRIVSGEGGVTGTFDRILQPTEGLAARTRFQVYYTTGFDIDLYVTPTAYSADLVGKVNGNGLATAAALDALVEASDAGTTTAEQTDLLRAVWQQDAVALPVLVTALTGESHAKLAALAQSNATALGDDVTGRLGQGVLLDTSSTRIDQLLWANIGYGDLSVDADASADRFDARQRRATAGIDVYRSSNVAWGAGLGRTTSELERSPLDNTLDSNAFFAYGAARAGAVVLDGMLSYSADRWESQRPDALGADGSLSGKASGTTRMASAGVSLPFTAAGLSWQPSLRGNWQKVERNAYREGGDSLAALDVARLQAEGSRATLGLSVGSLRNDPLAARGTWQFGLQAGINHGQARQATVTTALAGQRVDLSAAEAGKAFGRAQLQGTVRLGASTYLYGGVSTEQGSGVENNSVNAGIRIAL